MSTEIPLFRISDELAVEIEEVAAASVAHYPDWSDKTIEELVLRREKNLTQLNNIDGNLPNIPITREMLHSSTLCILVELAAICLLLTKPSYR